MAWLDNRDDIGGGLEPEPKGMAKGCAHSVSLRTLKPEPTGMVKALPVVAGCRRSFRMWRVYVDFPNGKQVTVMWNRLDTVLRVKKYLEDKTSVPWQELILHKRRVRAPCGRPLALQQQRAR